MKQEIEIVHIQELSTGIFEAMMNGKKVGELTYRKQGNNCWIVNHTEVAEQCKGQGIARLLVDAVVLYAKKNGYYILPVCSYVKALFNRVSEFQECLYKEEQ